MLSKCLSFINHESENNAKNAMNAKYRKENFAILCEVFVFFALQKILKQKSLYTSLDNVVSILFTVSSLPITEAISKTPGPNFPPTSIIRKGSISSPGFNS